MTLNAAVFQSELTRETLEVEQSAAVGSWIVEVGFPGGSASATLVPGSSLIVGTSRSASLRVVDPTVSGRHCELRATERGVEVFDLGSKNGLLLGGARVPSALLEPLATALVIGRSCLSLTAASPIEDLLDPEPIHGLVGDSLVMRRLVAQVRRLAPLGAPVLLQGESGTGKDVVARALHELSGRSGQYVPLNAGAVPEALADAELFGHQRGAFTGAVATRPGAFEQAHRGTLFLDEVADLAASVQVKLLRVVEDGCVRSVGSSVARKVDVRIVSATWADLGERVRTQSFREDLLHRLSTITLGIPPLRRRKSDIPGLSATLLARYAPELGKKGLSSGALSRLVAHSFPGNVRELSSVLYRAALASSGSVISIRDLGLDAGLERDGRAQRVPADALSLLAEAGGNISAAARIAGVPRTTFRTWLERAKRSKARYQKRPISDKP